MLDKVREMVGDRGMHLTFELGDHILVDVNAAVWLPLPSSSLPGLSACVRVCAFTLCMCVGSPSPCVCVFVFLPLQAAPDLISSLSLGRVDDLNLEETRKLRRFLRSGTSGGHLDGRRPPPSGSGDYRRAPPPQYSSGRQFEQRNPFLRGRETREGDRYRGGGGGGDRYDSYRPREPFRSRVESDSVWLDGDESPSQWRDRKAAPSTHRNSEFTPRFKKFL